MSAAKHTPGPWRWFGRTDGYLYLATVHGGRVFVMDFDRHGMTGGQPRFRPYCPDCGKSDQMEYCPNVSKTRWHIGCIRCQNAKGYDTFAEMWTAWNALITPPAPAQPALFTVVTP